MLAYLWCIVQLGLPGWQYKSSSVKRRATAFVHVVVDTIYVDIVDFVLLNPGYELRFVETWKQPELNATPNAFMFSNEAFVEVPMRSLVYDAVTMLRLPTDYGFLVDKQPYYLGVIPDLVLYRIDPITMLRREYLLIEVKLPDHDESADRWKRHRQQVYDQLLAHHILLEAATPFVLCSNYNEFVLCWLGSPEIQDAYTALFRKVGVTLVGSAVGSDADTGAGGYVDADSGCGGAGTGAGPSVNVQSTPKKSRSTEEADKQLSGEKEEEGEEEVPPSTPKVRFPARESPKTSPEHNSPMSRKGVPRPVEKEKTQSFGSGSGIGSSDSDNSMGNALVYMTSPVRFDDKGNIEQFMFTVMKLVSAITFESRTPLLLQGTKFTAFEVSHDGNGTLRKCSMLCTCDIVYSETNFPSSSTSNFFVQQQLGTGQESAVYFALTAAWKVCAIKVFWMGASSFEDVETSALAERNWWAKIYRDVYNAPFVRTLLGRPALVMPFMRWIPAARRLELLKATGEGDASKVEKALRRFSAMGLHHGDVAWRNLALDSQDRVVLIDLGRVYKCQEEWVPGALELLEKRAAN
jgi:hypothetical protein